VNCNLPSVYDESLPNRVGRPFNNADMDIVMETPLLVIVRCRVFVCARGTQAHISFRSDKFLIIENLCLVNILA
jgi:hypothetical protein